MLSLPVRARVYLFGCYSAGVLALAWLLLHTPAPTTAHDWILGLGLGIVAALCQVFAVARQSTTGQRSDHLTLAPLFAALVLIPAPVLAIIMILTFVPEWYVHRRSWFGQAFNISAYLIATMLSVITRSLIISALSSHALESVIPAAVLGVLAMIPVFQGTQALLLAWTLKIARGQSFRQSGLFASDSLLLEISLICVGLGFATSYRYHPIVGLATGLPLFLIFDALHVPNLKEEASTDPKTGLANMRHFSATMTRALERAERSRQPLSLLVCDLDYLRSINNTYGHQAGDSVLQGIADVMRSVLRPNDLAGRFGGEEFVVLLPDTSPKDARIIAEDLRRTFAHTRFDIGHSDGPISATVSIGIASFPDDGRTQQGLMHEADLAVYLAKREGRNRVLSAGRSSRQMAGEWAREYLITGVAASQPTTVKSPLRSFIDRVTNAGSSDHAPATPDTQTARSAQRIPRHAPHAANQPSWYVNAFAALVLGLALALLAGRWNMRQVDWLAIGLFALITAIAEQISITHSHKNHLSVSITPIMVAALLYHEAGLAVASLAGALSIAIKTRSQPYRFAFNLGTMLLSAQAAHLTFHMFSGGIDIGGFGSLLIGALLAGLTYYAVNQVLLCSMRAMHERRSPISIWRAEYRWLWPHCMVLGGLALMMARGYLDYGVISVIVLIAPVAMMHLAFRQYLERTKVHIGELRLINTRLTDSYEATLQALMRALDTRDEETEEHSQRVRRYTELIALQLNVPAEEITEIGRGALLHDIGKIGIPDAILMKPGKLTQTELAVMRRHPEIGYGMIAHIPFLAQAAQVVLHHHEAYDGSGYPSRLLGDRIPLGARIFAVADAFDAITTDRPYRRARPIEAAITEIRRCRGSQFDPAIVDAFLAIPLAALMTVQEYHYEVHADVQPLPDEAALLQT